MSLGICSICMFKLLKDTHLIKPDGCWLHQCSLGGTWHILYHLESNFPEQRSRESILPTRELVLPRKRFIKMLVSSQCFLYCIYRKCPEQSEIKQTPFFWLLLLRQTLAKFTVTLLYETLSGSPTTGNAVSKCSHKSRCLYMSVHALIWYSLACAFNIVK